ncbi:hypothetical protein B0H14DRAFT_3521775 [Mycena olivaceomarginata]|nr:hypothetical protein B0H14DRAFT_3521775 [Mycena olivaceomarginata]
MPQWAGFYHVLAWQRTHVSATSTHAIRNPGKAVQQVRRHPTASGTAKATAALQKEEARLQRRAYEQEIEAFNEHRDREIARISKKFGKTDRYVRSVLLELLANKSLWTTTTTTLQDEMDDGAVFDEESLGKVEYERLMDQLEEKRQTETRGACATNKAAANDARKTSMSIGEQLTNLYERTGVRAFAIFSRGNADDDTLPQAVDSDNALEFFLQEMGTDQLDVMRKFERYSCTMDEATRKKNDAKSVRADMSKRLTKGLQHEVVMEYAKYDVVIRAGHGVEMAGSPKDVAVERAGSMNAETVRRILRMILGGEIQWVQMSKEARAALIKEQDAQRAESGGTLLKRKERSDKGTVRGPRVKQTQKTPRDTGPTLAVVSAGSGLPVPIPSLSHSPSVLDHDVPRISSNTNAPPAPSTAAATTAASNAAAASTPDLNLTDLLSMSDGALGSDLDFDLDFLKISSDMAAAFPDMMGMQATCARILWERPGAVQRCLCARPGFASTPRPTPSPTKSALTPLDVTRARSAPQLTWRM